ncbi:RDD family protein [Krasilnikovia sp. MM14-A1259]|uniref:RDD family protein n=1 Tax=Krasilnikovia sp. MM14-A1259 TaxID=3373539 RepID=UPI0038271C88
MTHPSDTGGRPDTPTGYGPPLGVQPGPSPWGHVPAPAHPPGCAPPPGYGPPPGHGPGIAYGPPPPGYIPPPGYGPPPGYQPPALSPGGQPLADFGTRLLAHLIDGAILTAVMLVIFVPVFFVFFANLADGFPSPADPYSAQPDASVVFRDFFLPLLLLDVGMVLLSVAAYYVYYVEMMYRSGQTVGKKVLKIKVVPLDPAATLTRGMATKRYLVAYVAGNFVPFMAWIDGLWQLWDKPFQQTLHDKAGRTVVVKVPA